jgi:hypothetical protein
LLNSIGSINSYLVIRFIPVLDTEVIIFDIHFQVG